MWVFLGNNFSVKLKNDCTLQLSTEEQERKKCKFVVSCFLIKNIGI